MDKTLKSPCCKGTIQKIVNFSGNKIYVSSLGKPGWWTFYMDPIKELYVNRPDANSNFNYK